MRRYLSWIEGLTTNQYVGGSNPSRRTTELPQAEHRSACFAVHGFSRFTIPILRTFGFAALHTKSGARTNPASKLRTTRDQTLRNPSESKSRISGTARISHLLALNAREELLLALFLLAGVQKVLDGDLTEEHIDAR